MKHEVRQREFGFVNWGGKRRGAGRKPKGERAGVSHAMRPRLAARFPVLVTMRLRAGLETLRSDKSHALIREAFALTSGDEFRVIEYSVQSNHLHLVAESSDQRALGRGMIGLAVRIARGLNKLWRRTGQVFADRYHARILTTPRAVRNALIYVVQDARKHGAWRALVPDVYSSGPSFGGRRNGTGACDSRATRANLAQSRTPWLVRARTWLLMMGWRRHGLIDPREVPVGSAAFA